MSQIRALTDSVIFSFAQTTRAGYFRSETEWGFKFAADDHATDKPRWGLVEFVGPDVKYVQPGDYILIEPLKWTLSVDFKDKQYWRTLESFIMLKSDEKPKDLI